MLTRSEALQLMHEYTASDSLRKHMLAVEGAMRAYAGRRATEDRTGVPWSFLTTRSSQSLAPLLDGFGQDVRSIRGPAGRRELSHVLKVFLIDENAVVREIYDSTFLHPQTVLNDIETLLMAP